VPGKSPASPAVIRALGHDATYVSTQTLTIMCHSVTIKTFTVIDIVIVSKGLSSLIDNIAVIHVVATVI